MCSYETFVNGSDPCASCTYLPTDGLKIRWAIAVRHSFRASSSLCGYKTFVNDSSGNRGASGTQGLSLFDELPVAPRWRQSSAKAPRRLHEATMVAPRATTEAPRRLHEAAVEPSWSLCGAFTNSTSPRCKKSVIPSAQPCGVSVFGFGLGLGLELRI